MAMPEGGGGGGNGERGSSSENDAGETRSPLRLVVSSHPPRSIRSSTASASASATSSPSKNRPSWPTSSSSSLQHLLPRSSSSASLHSETSSSASGAFRRQTPKKPPHHPYASSLFRRRCVAALLALAIALSALDFLGFVRNVSKNEGGRGRAHKVRGEGGGFRGRVGNSNRTTINVTSLSEGPPHSIDAAAVVADAVAVAVAVASPSEDDWDDDLKALEEDEEELSLHGGTTKSSTASSSSSGSGDADTNSKDDGDDDEDGDDDNDQEADSGGDEATSDGASNRTAGEGDGDYERDGDDSEETEVGKAAQDTSEGGGGGGPAHEEKTIPPAPAQLLYNQTYTNWSLLLSQLPVSPSRFLNEVPRGMRIAFVGDSVTRYQVLSFMYFLYTNGHWFPDDKSVRPNLLEKNDQDYGPKWNPFLNMSSYQLGEATGNHWCDCYRGVTTPNKIFENRYFRDTVNDNYVYFVTKLGPAAARGRWWPSKINQWKEPMSFQVQDGKAKWSYQWDSLIRRHLAYLDPKPTHVVFNEGLWAGLNNATYKIIRKALEDVNMTGIYKTTTKRSREQTPELKDHDQAGCTMFECLDVSWSFVLVMWPYYFDYGTHFTSTVYTLFNQQLLKLLKDLGAFNASTPAPP